MLTTSLMACFLAECGDIANEQACFLQQEPLIVFFGVHLIVDRHRENVILYK